MTTETSQAPKLAREIFTTWTEAPCPYVFDKFGLRRACTNASSILLADYTEENGKRSDQLCKIWSEACDLDDAAAELALKASKLRQLALEILA